MEAVGLRLLQGADLAPTFAAAGALPQSVAARVSLSKFARVNTVKGRWALIEDLAAVPQHTAACSTRATAQRAAPAAAAAAPAAPAAPQLSLEDVQRSVRGVAAEILGEDALDGSGQFPAGGFDSLSAVELSNKVGQALGLDLPSTIVFDYPSVPAMAAFLLAKLAPKQQAQQAQSDGLQLAGPAALGLPAAATPHDLVLTMSAAARLPTPAHEAATWTLLPGHDAIAAVPFDRWDLEAPRVSGKAVAVACSGGITQLPVASPPCLPAPTPAAGRQGRSERPLWRLAAWRGRV